MYGTGIWRGLRVTLQHFLNTYIEDIRYGFRRHVPVEAFPERQGLEARGIFTVEYPEEKIATPERFRFIPFLVVENYDHPERPGHDWCTSCGICAKVCPPQCIWIVRSDDPETGRPIPEPEEFYIDIDICMNCGFCAEFCPFDAIKMDHEYEIATFDRFAENIYNKERLGRPVSYYAEIRPTNYEREEAARKEKEDAKAAK